jgi:Tol biopolymer transport system component
VSKARILTLAVLLAISSGTVASGRASTPSPIVFAADRAPSLSGEIYRLAPNGRRIDLSRSPYQDTNPVVSSDGKRVAFISDRGSTAGVYEVGIDGRGLVVVVRKVPGLDPHTPDLAWQPHGRRLAVGFPATHRVAIVQPGRKPVFVRGAWGYGSWQPWSPDGRALLVSVGHELRAVTPQGRPLWHVPAKVPSGGWSPQGELAVTTNGGAAVYDERGRLQFRVRFAPSLSNAGPIWSPDGSELLLSSASGFDFAVWTNTGHLSLRKHVRYGELGWADDDRLALAYTGRCFCGVDYVNAHTGRLSRGSLRWFDPLSPDRKLAIVTSKSGASFKLGVARARGGAPKPYAPVPGCWDDGDWEAAVDSLQFVGRSHAVVYASLCYEPFSDLYSIAPDGTDLHEIGAVKPYATEPVLSPDGSEIAFSWAKLTGLSCGGCASEIRVANADGTGTRILTKPSTDCTFDLSPSWSPDGQTILYSEETCNTPGELFTLPATGGSPHDLGIMGTDPAWGPSRIAYVGAAQSNKGLWTANPDGSDPIRVAENGSQPTWSVDGRLAYLLGHNRTTVVVGSTQVKLPFTSVTSLAWSPDGSRFIVTARRAKTASPDVYTVRTDGTDPIRLTKNYDAWGVSWR